MTQQAVTVPDLGGTDEAEVIEVVVADGVSVSPEQTLIIVKSDKASMEIPAPGAGVVRGISVRVGDRVRQGDTILMLETGSGVEVASVGDAALADSAGRGPKGRTLEKDVQPRARTPLAAGPANTATAPPAPPEAEFAAYGPVETVVLSNIQKATVGNMLRSWLNVPHVTQFDFADLTDLEAYRSSLKPEMQQRNNKLTPLPFLLVAVARALRDHPRFNASLHPDGAQLVLKQYLHIGIAVDTPQGLVVPVIRNVNTKSIWELAAEARELADRARARKLKLVDMQGSCFTISSLGNIGGEGFTPIVNAPELAILGVSKLAVRPVWNGSEFLPRKTLPLSLSYDHRVINGADAGRFMSSLVAMLGDIRCLLP